MHIAIEGCLHGELDKVYETVLEIQEREGIRIDLLISCGDFQSVRNLADLRCMAVPDKYKEMGSFWKYYSGEAKAPVLTLFIGGNHEASNYLQELPYGGWVAPNIYYLGYAGVVNVNGLRIGGMSGIFKGGDYLKGRYEIPPYDNGSIRSVYHTRNLDVYRMKQLESPGPEIMVSHDWPRGIHLHGDTQQLLKCKPFFQDDIDKNQLGSGPSMEVLEAIKPKYWFAGHLHVKFAAVVHHGGDKPEQEEEEERGEGLMTKFLALDKCLPKRRFLQILTVGPEIQEGEEVVLSHDAEWLAVLKATNDLMTVRATYNHMPGSDRSEAKRKALDEILGSEMDLRISPENFRPTVAPFNPQTETIKMLHKTRDPVHTSNPQTEALCNLLGIDDPIALLQGAKPKSAQEIKLSASSLSSNLASAPCCKPIATGGSGNLSRSLSSSLKASLPSPIHLQKEKEACGDNKEADETASPKQTEVKDCDEDDGDLGFVVDTRGEREKGGERAVHEEATSSTVDTVTETPAASINDQGVTQKDVNDSPAAVSPKKKLKRRNLAIYKEDDSD